LYEKLMSKRPLIATMLTALVAATVAGATGAYWASTRRGSQPETRPVLENASASDELENRIAALEAQTALLRNSERTALHVALLRNSERTANETAPANSPQEEKRRKRAEELAIPHRERAQRAAEEMYDALDEQVRTGAPDPAWRPEQEAYAALREFSGTRVLSLTCIATFCRVDLSNDSAETKDKLVGEISTKPPFSGSGIAFRYDDSDPRHVTLYVQRPGFVLGGNKTKKGEAR
jgi:hypothetical protein